MLPTTKVVISCGPIPARLDSVKFITNRFKGGLAFKTAANLIDALYDVTIIKWVHTPLPADGYALNQWNKDNVHIINVRDVFEYYNWFKDNANNYNAFIMAAAVANLTPSNPWEGKFPSHNYQVGEQFDIKFEIAPRAIDIVKQVNPRACLIGYKLFDGAHDELIKAARLTQKESKANIIFANTPAEAKSKKYAVMADNTVLECDFDEHIRLIMRAIEARYFKTIIEPLTEEEQNDPHIRQALATVKMFEKTFQNDFGTVAIPVYPDRNDIFATTSRGHAGEPVIIRSVDHIHTEIHASGKATLNVPTLDATLKTADYGSIVIHRHDDDPLFLSPTTHPIDIELPFYVFPGTLGEAGQVQCAFYQNKKATRLKLVGHGDIRKIPIRSVDWSRYYEQFPDRYFTTPDELMTAIKENKGKETLEIGGNTTVAAKFAYDAFVPAQNAINLTWSDICVTDFDFIFARNAINYFTGEQLIELLSRTKRFMANTFLNAPEEKVTDQEASILYNGQMHHTLRLPDDSIARHSFFAHTLDFYANLAYMAGVELKTKPYGKNSALLDFIRPTKHLYEISEKGIVHQLSILSCGIAPAGGLLVAATDSIDAHKRAMEYRQGDRTLRTAYGVEGFSYPITNCII